MRILIIAYYYPPLSTGGTQRPEKWGKYLAKAGHEVSILTHSYQSRYKIEPGNPKIIRVGDISFNKDRSNFRKKCQWFILRLFTEGLNILGFYHSIYSWWKNRVIKNASKIIQHIQPDIIIATYPPVETLEIGTYFSIKFHLPLMTDFRDGLMFEPIETFRINKYQCIRKKYQEIEVDSSFQSVAITAIAEPIINYYVNTYRPFFSAVISNAFDPYDLEMIQSDIHFSPKTFNIVFTGRFGLSDKFNQVQYFFDAIRDLSAQTLLSERSIKIHLVGEYQKEELSELADLINQGVIELHGFVKRSTSLAFQKAADLLLIITPPDRSSATSAKIFEYLFSETPILALTYQTVLETIIKETNTGWLVHPHQTKAITELLLRIISDEEFYNSLHPNWEKIKQYSIAHQIEILIRLLNQIQQIINSSN